MSPKVTRILPTFVVVGTILVCLVFSEATLRKLDGYQFSSLELRQASSILLNTTQQNGFLEKVRGYAEKMALADGAKIEWFDQEPRPLDRSSVPPQWKAVYDKLPQSSVRFDLFKLWNSAFVASEPCTSRLFRDFPGFAFIFDSPDGSSYPRYRFVPSSITPMGLVTNAFGWRGPAVNYVKPDKVVRIAFVGASTTVHQHSYPFSYPELIGFWLNLWAKSKNLGVAFETINMGREGIASSDIAAVVRDEAVPMQPDYVVYYEGSNQFDVGSIVKSLPRRRRSGTETEDNDHRLLSILSRYSAIARRIQFLKIGSSAAESFKPDYEIEWPSEVDEIDPKIDSPKLPTNLPIILKDLDSIRQDLNGIKSELIISSFNWNVHEGMKLDPVRHKSIRDYLDIGMYPFRYRDIERVNKFQNRVFKKYAVANHLPFIEVAEKYPTDPDLFTDPIHETYLGVKLRAWLVLQQLMPILENDLATGSRPHPWDQSLQTRFTAPTPLSTRTVALGCTSAFGKSAKLIGDLSLSKLYADNVDSNVKTGEPTEIKTASAPYAYAAKIRPDALFDIPDGAIFVVDLQVKEGAVQIGVLSKDASRFLKTEVVNAAAGRVSIPLAPGESHNIGDIVIANGLDSNTASTALIHSIRLYQSDERVNLLGKDLGPGILLPTH